MQITEISKKVAEVSYDRFSIHHQSIISRQSKRIPHVFDELTKKTPFYYMVLSKK